jgi:hypothetical protein
MPDMQRAIAEASARHRVRIDGDDPAAAFVTLNQLLLEQLVGELAGQLQETITRFEASIQKAEFRAGKVLAAAVKESVSELHHELKTDFTAATRKVHELQDAASGARERYVAWRWTLVVVLTGVAMFCCGVLVGRKIAG